MHTKHYQVMNLHWWLLYSKANRSHTCTYVYLLGLSLHDLDLFCFKNFNDD